MLLQSKIFRLLFVFSLVFSLSVLAFGDTIRLKDGGIIKGKIVSFTGGQFVIVVGEGQRERRLSFTAEEVASIEFDSSVSPVPSVQNTAQIPSNSRKPEIKTVGNTTIITPRQSEYGDVSENNAPAASSKKDVKSSSGNTNSSSPRTNSNTVPADTNSTAKTSTNNSPIINASTAKSKPISIPVNVLADNTSNGWTNTGWVVKKGQMIKISGSGRVSLGNGRFTDAGGVASLPDANKLLRDKPTGGLLAVVGDDNNDFIFVGNSYEFTATRDGTLFLGVNEGNLNDNSGSFNVTVEIDPTLYK